MLWEGDSCTVVGHDFLPCSWVLHVEKWLPVHMETDLAFKDGNAEHESASQKEAQILEDKVYEGASFTSRRVPLQHLGQLKRSRMSLLSPWEPQ